MIGVLLFNLRWQDASNAYRGGPASRRWFAAVPSWVAPYDFGAGTGKTFDEFIANSMLTGGSLTADLSLNLQK